MAKGTKKESQTQEDSCDQLSIAIVTDAWSPQVNGVVTTYQNTIQQLSNMGINCYIVHPGQPDLKTVPLPGYREIEIVVNPWRIKSSLDWFIKRGYKIHVATEGPLGLFAVCYLAKKKYPFTTCYHSKFPEFIQARTGIAARWFYPYFRWFHSASKCVMVPSQGIKHLLEDRGFKNVVVWTRGVDSNRFKPNKQNQAGNYILCVSRVSREKNLDAFCQLDHPNKVLIGDGPYLDALMTKYPDVHFEGKQTGNLLVSWYDSAQCFVFPSTEDTFGVVLLESIACGTPVAAYPCPGADEVLEYANGAISTNLQDAVNEAITKNRQEVYETSKAWTWRRATENFVKNLK